MGLVLHVADSYQLLQNDAMIIEKVISNIQRLQQQNFCGATTNVLVLDSDRTDVAFLRVIDLSLVIQLYEKYLELLRSPLTWDRPNGDALLAKCYGILEDVGLAWPSMWSGACTESLIYASRVVSRFLDLAMISYCGAHFEAFDRTCLDEEVQRFSIRCDSSGSWITMYRRPFRCLGPHFRYRSAWVFQSCNYTTELSSSPLYLSTTLEQFTDIFGPVWKTMHHTYSTSVMKYNIGIGYIIAWEPGHDDPRISAGEVFCHWTDNVEDLDQDLILIPKSARLLIGGTPCLSENKYCQTRQSAFTNEMKSAGRYKPINVRLPQIYRDSVTVQAGFSHFLSAGVQGQYKMREGFSIKDAFIAAWTSEPAGRSIELILNKWAVAVSACTANTKRITIFELLQSSTMRRYLDRYDEGIDEDDLRHYFAALDKDSAKKFIKAYKRPLNRKPFGTVISRCFEALKHTGVDSKLCLKALWAPKGKTPCVIDYGHKEHGWTGILVDSHETCTIAIVIEECLEVRDGEPSCQEEFTADEPRYSVLETAVVINPKAPSLSRNENYYLGRVGELRPYASIDASTIFVGWSNSKASRMIKKVFRNALVAHREFIHCDDRKEDIVTVLVASHRSKKMRVVVVRNGRRIEAQMGMIK